jgi:hypothetical protein
MLAFSECYSSTIFEFPTFYDYYGAISLDYLFTYLKWLRLCIFIFFMFLFSWEAVFWVVAVPGL